MVSTWLTQTEGGPSLDGRGDAFRAANDLDGLAVGVIESAEDPDGEGEGRWRFSLVAKRLPPDGLKNEKSEIEPPPPSFFFPPKKRPKSFLGPVTSDVKGSVDVEERVDWREKTWSRLWRPTKRSEEGRGEKLGAGEGCAEDGL